MDEKEGAVLAVVELREHHGSTERPAELIQAERWEGCTFRAKEISRIHCRVAKKFKQTAMQVVAAGLANDIDHGARVAPDVGAIEVRLNLELADRFDRRAKNDGERQPLVVIDSVVEEVIRAF